MRGAHGLNEVIAAHEAHADVLELALAALVEPGDGIGRDDHAEVALAGLIDRGARTVGEVAAAEDERGHVALAQVLFERRAVERAPARRIGNWGRCSCPRALAL